MTYCEPICTLLRKFYNLYAKTGYKHNKIPIDGAIVELYPKSFLKIDLDQNHVIKRLASEK